MPAIANFDWPWYRFKVNCDVSDMDLIGRHCDTYWLLATPGEKCWVCGEQPEVQKMGESYAGWAYGNPG